MSDEKSLKNPLALALGLVLKQMREESGRSAKDIAETLEVSPSTYRLIESGSNNLRPVYAPKLLRDNTFRDIAFSPLAILLQAIYSLDTLREETGSLLEAIDQLNETIAPLDRIIDSLRDSVAAYLERDNTVDLKTRIIRSGLDEELKTILKSPAFYKDIETQAGLTTKRFLKSVSPFYFDAAASMLQDLARSEPLIKHDRVGEWERENSGRMVDIIAVINDLSVFFHRSNTDLFDYRYILNRRIEDTSFTVRIIYDTYNKETENTMTPGEFKEWIVDNLYRYYAWETNNNEETSREVVDLLVNEVFQFMKIRDDYVHNLLTTQVQGRVERLYDSIWIFTLSPIRNKIGMGDIDIRCNPDTSYEDKYSYSERVRIMTFEEVNSVYDSFENYWKRVRDINKVSIDELD